MIAGLLSLVGVLVGYRIAAGSSSRRERWLFDLVYRQRIVNLSPPTTEEL